MPMHQDHKDARPHIHWREVVESYPCTDCGAGPGDRCHTSGRWPSPKWEPHACRSRLASANGWDYADPADPDPNPDLGPEWEVPD
jgi:hypothetical protein